MRRAPLLFARALRLRCPACGKGRLFAGWFDMRKSCPACGVWIDREEGYFLGAIAVNLILTELLCAGGILAILILSWPNPPWLALQVGGVLYTLLFPIAFFPWSRTLWLAMDWTVRPPAQGDPRGEQPRPVEPRDA